MKYKMYCGLSGRYLKETNKAAWERSEAALADNLLACYWCNSNGYVYVLEEGTL